MLQLLVQVPDVNTMDQLIALVEVVAADPRVHVFVIEDGRVREVLR